MSYLSREELGKLAAKYQEKADRAYQNYQETGMTRYDRERRNAEDLAEALRAAANAVEDKQALNSLRADVVWLAALADERIAEAAPREQLEAILQNLISVAAVKCNYKRRERLPEKGECV